MSQAYCELQVAQELFGCAPPELDATQRQRVDEVTQRRLDIERRVLASEEGRAVCVPEATLQHAVDEVCARYADADAFHAALAHIGLDETSLRLGLQRQLAVDAVLEKISAESEPISELDVELFYRLNSERFTAPERRRARHVLVTINEAFAENRREAALARIRQAENELRTQSFEHVAQRYSECPTAVNGGLLGDVRREQLYPELDAVLFELKVGETSDVVESPMGFHLLRCEAIFSALHESLEQAAPRIREHLRGKQAQQRQKAWLEGVAADERSLKVGNDVESSHVA